MENADNMFRKLGYVLIQDDEEMIRYIEYGNEDLDIKFYKKYKVIGGFPTYDYFCDMPLLRAINKKVSELGWRKQRDRKQYMKEYYINVLKKKRKREIN